MFRSAAVVSVQTAGRRRTVLPLHRSAPPAGRSLRAAEPSRRGALGAAWPPPNFALSATQQWQTMGLKTAESSSETEPTSKDLLNGGEHFRETRLSK